MMELAINEVKTQAKKLLRALKADDNLANKMKIPFKKVAISSVEELKLKHCLSLVSLELGFANWHEAHAVLSGTTETLEGVNMGTFLYPQACGGFINEWYANYQEAKESLASSANKKWILPYKNQYIVVKQEYISVFNLAPALMPLWREMNNDLVLGYKTLPWDQLIKAVIKNKRR
jgi:hypothetical protein